MASPYGHDHRILTLASGDMRWRKIDNPLIHGYVRETICIDGVLYYSVHRSHEIGAFSYAMVCFDFRSEKYKVIEAEGFPYIGQLINYKGKLGGIRWSNGNTTELSLWVLEDFEKQEWSKHVYTLPKNPPIYHNNVSFAGVTATGEIVLSERRTSERFYVFYFNPERNTLQRVEIQGLEKRGQVYTYVDHVEDLNVNDAKYLKSIPRLNIIRARPKPQKPDLGNSAPWPPSVKNKQSTNLLKNKYELLASLE